METEMIKRSALFKSMTDDEIETCLTAMRASEKSCKKGTFILHAGDLTDRMGMVLSGSVTIENNDIWGNCTILSHVGTGQFFAETYALLREEVLLVDVKANEDCRILFLNIGNLLEDAPAFGWKEKLLKNLLVISSHKNLALSGRSFHTSPKSCRARLLSYLNSISLQKHTSEFDIPFDRQQLADYLNLERTNMSKELAKMQRDGLIKFRKNHFILIHGEELSFF